MKNYCYIYLLAACMAPMSLQAKKAIPYRPDVHSIQPVNLRRIVRNAVGQHSQTASDRHFSCSVEKVHILRSVYRY